MPTYDFENTKTGEVTTEMMSISELDKFKKDNPHMKQLISKVNISKSGVMGMGRLKTDSGWKDNLNRIANAHPGTKLNDLYGSKSIKDIKTKQVVEKHRKRQEAQRKK